MINLLANRQSKLQYHNCFKQVSQVPCAPVELFQDITSAIDCKNWIKGTNISTKKVTRRFSSSFMTTKQDMQYID